MTIEEKAKAYDEALEKAKNYHKQLIDEDNPEWASEIEKIFPELVESEDERIRKKLIHLVKKSHEQGGYALHKWEADEMALWLKKQGKERTVNYPIEGMFPYTDPADTLDGEIENIWNKLRNCDNTFTAAKSGFYEVIHHFATWLEKQGKETSEKEFTFKALPRLLEMIEVSDRAKAYTEKLAVALDNEGYHTDAKIVRESIKIMNGEEVPMATMDEQKPVDNIEPKFKVGDWITNGDYTWKIVEVKPLDYILQSQDGNIVDDTISHVDEQFHSFTIEDAKDGDTLINKNYMGESPFIFKETKPSNIKTDVPNPLTVFGYCGIGGAGFTKSSGWGDTANCIYHPATKEQRDTLLKAMADAGWEFDFDKKELKKIEKKSQRMVSAEAKEALYDKPTDEEMKELLRTEYEKGRADTLSEMKSSWSEEDEKRLKSCLNILQPKTLLGNVETINTKWLRSLKQRIGG